MLWPLLRPALFSVPAPVFGCAPSSESPIPFCSENQVSPRCPHHLEYTGPWTTHVQGEPCFWPPLFRISIDTSFPHLNMSRHFAPDGHNVWYAEAVMELPAFAPTAAGDCQSFGWSPSPHCSQSSAFLCPTDRAKMFLCCQSGVWQSAQRQGTIIGAVEGTQSRVTHSNGKRIRRRIAVQLLMTLQTEGGSNELPGIRSRV